MTERLIRAFLRNPRRTTVESRASYAQKSTCSTLHDTIIHGGVFALIEAIPWGKMGMGEKDLKNSSKNSTRLIRFSSICIYKFTNNTTICSLRWCVIYLFIFFFSGFLQTVFNYDNFVKERYVICWIFERLKKNLIHTSSWIDTYLRVRNLDFHGDFFPRTDIFMQRRNCKDTLYTVVSANRWINRERESLTRFPA